MEGHGVSLEKIGAVGVSEEGHRVRHHPDVASAAVKVRLAPFAVLVRHDQHLVIKALRVCRVIVALLRIRVESCHKQKSVSLLKSIIFMSMLNSLVITISILHNDTCVKNFGYITSVFFQFEICLRRPCFIHLQLELLRAASIDFELDADTAGNEIPVHLFRSSVQIRNRSRHFRMPAGHKSRTKLKIKQKQWKVSLHQTKIIDNSFLSGHGFNVTQRHSFRPDRVVGRQGESIRQISSVTRWPCWLFGSDSAPRWDGTSSPKLQASSVFEHRVLKKSIFCLVFLCITFNLITLNENFDELSS